MPVAPHVPPFPQNDAPLALLDHVTVKHGLAPPVFRELSLRIEKDRHLALLGQNGSGKSTFLRLLQGDLRPAQGTGGSICWNFGNGPEKSALAARAHARAVSPAQQSAYARNAWQISGEDIILSGLENSSMPYAAPSAFQRGEAERLASRANALPLLTRRLPGLSQGQVRLLLILRALISQPLLLLLDEPFDGLDDAARTHVEAAISLAAQEGRTVLLSAHRERDIPGFIREALLFSPQGVTHASLPLPKPQPPAGRHTRLAALHSAPHPAAPCASKGMPLFSLQGVDVFIERKKVLHNIRWNVHAGEQWLVSGPNGSGKSTLLRLLYGEEFAAYGGTLLWKSGPRPALEAFRKSVGYVSDRLQDCYAYDLSAEEVVISGIRGHMGLYATPTAGERDTARFWLETLGLSQKAHEPFSALSSGLARRVLLARSLACAPEALLLDEPCSGLDSASREYVLNALSLLAKQGITIIYVTHRPNERQSFFTHELVLQNGTILRAEPAPGRRA